MALKQSNKNRKVIKEVIQEEVVTYEIPKFIFLCALILVVLIALI